MKRGLLIGMLCIWAGWAQAQTKGTLTVHKDPLLDSLIARRIEVNKVKPSVSNPAPKVATNQIGYRVQIYFGIDRREAFNEQARFKSLYPRLNAYITYKEPNYYVRAGDFRTRLEAQKFQTELRKQFSTLLIIREKINPQ